MDSGGRHTYEVGVGDVLSERRQREIERVVDALSEWQPDIVAVEVLREEQATLDRVYGEYLKGEELPEGWKRGEVVQIGFRLAKRLGHRRLLAVDCFPDFGMEGLEPEAVREFMGYVPPGLEDYVSRTLKEMGQGERSVGEYLLALNDGPLSEFNDALMLSSAVAYPDSDTAYGVLSNWFVRNVCILRNLYSSLREGTERVLLMYGSGHVPFLRYALSTSPLFRYVSPVPYLKAACG